MEKNRSLRLLGKLFAFLVMMGLILSLVASAFASEASATMEAAVEQFLNESMEKAADNATDGWERYIYSRGASGIELQLENYDVTKGKPLAVNFMLTSGNVHIKDQPKYEGDPEAYLNGIIQSMSAPDLKVKLNLSFEQSGNGYTAAFAPKAEASLNKTVKSAAASAKKAFGDKKVLTALSDYFMPSPIAVTRKVPSALRAGENQMTYIRYLNRIDLNEVDQPLLPSLLYAIKGCKLDLSGGPQAIALTFSAPDLSAMIGYANSEVQKEIPYDVRAKEYTSWDLMLKIVLSVERQAIDFRHGKAKGITERYEFDMFNMPQNEDAFSISSTNHDTEALWGKLESAAGDIESVIGGLPDYPAIKNPKSGLVSGKSSGTTCKFVMPKDGLNYSISVYSAYTSKKILTVFSSKGKQVSVRIPMGDVYFIVGEGDIWYGPNHLFGEGGYYMKTVNQMIKSNRYIHTFTIKPKTGGNVETYPLNYDDVLGN